MEAILGVAGPPVDPPRQEDADASGKAEAMSDPTAASDDLVSRLRDTESWDDAQIREEAAETIEALAGAARRLLDNVSPFISALEVEHGADGEELFGDLAEALGLPRDYGSDSYRERTETDR